ncbi:major capsid protein [uncultured Mediterranean phage]|nr:major capsid protein [uncultured Mediterranean phage]
MARNYVRTITDMERYYYGAGNAMGYSYSGSELLKADSPMLSTTGGTYQAIYGRKVWSQLNQEFNAFSILPKKPWDRSGWRVITGRPNSGTLHGGVAENATLPETVKPTFQHVAAKPKTIAHTFDMSETAIFLADKDDGLGDIRSVMKEEMGKHHAEMVNKMLCTDVDTPAANNFESLDRVTAAYSNNATTTTGLVNGHDNLSADSDLDIYSIDRSANSWSNAEMSNNAVSNVSTDRVLSLDLIDEMFQKLWVRGGNPKVMLTGYDTLMRLQQLLQSQQRFMEEKRVTPTYNGVKGVPGMEAGFIVATYNGVPIIPTKNMLTDSISRVYFLDTDYLHFSTAIPTQYFESGIETGDPFAINRLGQEGLYRTMGEIWTTFFGSQGSLRDLK